MEVTGWIQQKRSKQQVRYPKIMKACCGTCAHSTWRSNAEESFYALPLDCYGQLDEPGDKTPLYTYSDYYCPSYSPAINVAVHKP